eukprot:s275_g38.t1
MHHWKVAKGLPHLRVDGPRASHDCSRFADRGHSSSRRHCAEAMANSFTSLQSASDSRSGRSGRSQRSCRSQQLSEANVVEIVPHMKQIVHKEVRLARQRQQVVDFLKFHKFNPEDVNCPRVSCLGFVRFFPLQHAAQKKDWEMLYLLLFFGADPRVLNSFGKSTYDYIKSGSMKESVRHLHSKFSRKPTQLITRDVGLISCFA